MRQPSVRKNYIYRLSYEILILITPFITTPYISRVLGADGIGIYSYTSSIMTYFTLLAALGTASYGAREIAQHRDDKRQTSKLFWEIELLTVGTTLLCLMIWCVIIFVSRKYSCYYIALIPTLIGTMADISWYFTGYEQIKYIVIRNALCKILGIILLFTLIRERDDLLIYMVINSSITLLGNLSMWTYLPKMIVKIDMRSLIFKKHIRETIIYFIPTIATSIYTVLDKTLIGALTGSSYQNGYYEQATKVINIIKSLAFVSINAVMGARLSYLFAEKKYKEIHNRIERSMNFILLIGFGCTFGLIGIASNFIPVFFGDGYGPVIPIIYLMSPLILIIGVSNCLGGQYYIPSNQRKKSAKIIILGAIINFCFNLFLIPNFGAEGAAVGSLIAESVITMLYIRLSNGYITIALLWRISRKRLLSGLTMCLVVMYIGTFINLKGAFLISIQIFAGVCLYTTILMLFKDDMLHELLTMGINIIKQCKENCPWLN